MIAVLYYRIPSGHVRAIHFPGTTPVSAVARWLALRGEKLIYSNGWRAVRKSTNTPTK